MRSLHICYTASRIGRGGYGSATAEDKGCTRLSHRQLREELRQPRIFDDDCQSALAFLVHVNWAGVSDGRAQSDWICSDFKPARLVVFYPFAIPLLIGDQVISIFEPALLELDISDNHLILIDAAFENAVGPRDFHHFEAEIA